MPTYLRTITIPAAVLALTLTGCATPSTTTTDGATVASTSKAAAGTVSQRNALKSAESYLNTTGFSRLGLIQQLSSSAGDSYPKADATWAVDHLNADWNAQAVRSGKSYLDMTGFSRAGLIQQLSSDAGDKYTKAQATYAANKLGLK